MKKELLKESIPANDGNDAMSKLEALCHEMNASFVDEYGNNTFIIESGSQLDVRYTFTLDNNGEIRLSNIEGLDEIKQIFGEINTLQKYFGKDKSISL